jgi:hypothetical protein
MNPQSATLPAAPAMAPAPAAPAPPAASSQAVQTGPSMVTNIPVHAQQAAPAPANDDAELDKIMQDVGHELKKEDKKPEHHGMLGFLHHDPKPLVKVNNQAANGVALSPAVPLPAPVAVFVAVCVTGFLVAAAIAAFRQQA